MQQSTLLEQPGNVYKQKEKPKPTSQWNKLIQKCVWFGRTRESRAPPWWWRLKLCMGRKMRIWQESKSCFYSMNTQPSPQSNEQVRVDGDPCLHSQIKRVVCGKNWALKAPKFIRWHCKASKAPLDLCDLANLAPICPTVSSLMTTTVSVHGDTSFSYHITNCYQIGWLVTFVSVCFGPPPIFRCMEVHAGGWNHQTLSRSTSTMGRLWCCVATCSWAKY